MDVLHRIHRGLRPGGLLLDVHPEPEHAPVEVRGGEEPPIRAGELDRAALIGKVLAARAGLDSIVAAGSFQVERERTFEVVSHHASAEAWVTYRSERGSESILSDAVLARVRELLVARPGREILVRERVRAARLRRV